MKYLFGLSIAIFICLVACASSKKTSLSNSQQLIKAIQEGKDFTASDKTFDGDIIFKDIFNSNNGSIYISSQLIFDNCTFNGKIEWSSDTNQRLYFEKEVRFDDCTFEKDLLLNETVFRSRLQIVDCLFRENLNLDRNSFLIKTNIDKNEIGQNISTQYITAHENLSIFGNSIGNNLLLQGAQINGMAQLSTNELNGSIDLTKCNFKNDLIMNYTKGGKKLLAGNVTVSRTVQMINVENFAYVDFSDSFILGRLDYNHLSNIEAELANTHIGELSQ